MRVPSRWLSALVLIAAATPTARADDGAPASSIAWDRDLDHARETAREKKKLVLQLVLTGSPGSRDRAKARELLGRVTFRDPAIVERVSRRFVAVARDGAPDSSNDLRSATDDLAPAFAALWPDGKASASARTLVWSSEGELLHEIPGYVSASTLERELDFAVTLSEAADRAGKSPAARRKAIVDPLLARAGDLERRFGITAHVAVIRQRAYIAGVETSSTGVTPVLNPVVGGLNTGAVLEVTDPGVSGGGTSDDEARAGGFASALAGIHREIARDPEAAREAADRMATRAIAGAGAKLPGEIAVKPTPPEIEAAEAALLVKKTVETALLAHASREKDAAAWKKARSEAASSGKLARRFLLEAVRAGKHAEAAFEVLRHVTGELIPDDEAAWTLYLSR
ncbi:hypothetical protein HY251_19900 [bacterium]|nr:hypothetical protein [bacterium]